MDWTNKAVVVTGGRRGIGKAYAEALAGRGARIAVGDLDADEAHAVGKACGGFGGRCDVSDEGEVAHFLTQVEKEFGRVDVVISNAGVVSSDGPLYHAASAPNAQWERSWAVNVMGSVYLARHAVPGMVRRGEGVFVVVASAAGLLAQLGSAPYTATKHAAVAFAEALAIAHGDEGLQVACVCPQGVNTAMAQEAVESLKAAGDILEPEEVVAATLSALEDQRFLVLPHPEVAGHLARRTNERDRWLGGMRKLRRQLVALHGRPF